MSERDGKGGCPLIMMYCDLEVRETRLKVVDESERQGHTN